MTSAIDAHAEREKRSAALSSVLAAVFLTILKLVVGFMTGSLGILAEAAHSGLDLVAALVTLFAVRLSDRPPDQQHLYGHGKIENLSALVETLLLLVTCAWIVYEAIQRLFFEHVEIKASFWAFAVMAISIIVDVSRSRLLYQVARKYDSQALEADALHFSTDIWSSAVVIVGLGLVWLSERLGPEWGWLAQADAVAALVVAMIVIYVSLQLGKRAVQVLLDAAPTGMVERFATEAAQVPGVQTVGPVRVRQAGAHIFADLTVTVERSASLEEAHKIATAVERRIGDLISQGDVVVHVDPVRQSDESLPQAVSAIAALTGLRAHNIHAHELAGRYFVDLHLEVPPELTLDEAHERAARLEAAVRDELPYVSDIRTHIEPAGVTATSAVLQQAVDERLRAKIVAVVEGVPGLYGCHNLHIRPGPDGFDVVLDCRADAALPIAQAHHLADEAERQVYAQVPGLDQILIHVEPSGKEQ